MKYHIAHKIRLNPTLRQEEYFVKACGIARFAYNLGLEAWNIWYKQGRKFSYWDIRNEFNQVKHEHFPWVSEVSSHVTQYEFDNLNSAFTRFFRYRSKHPKFHKKGPHDSFAFYPVKLSGFYVKVPKLGQVRMAEKLRFEGRVLDKAVVSRDGNNWFISITVETNTENQFKQVKNQDRVGIDLGLSQPVVLSTGEVFDAPKPLKKYLGKLARAQRVLRRRIKGSRNWYKQLRELRALYYRIKCIRLDWIHKVTTYITKRFGYIAIEDLDVSNMMKNHRLARSISDVGWGEFRRQLAYKSTLRGNEVTVVNRFYPSSKTCNQCGLIDDNLTLSDRIYQCECGNVIDRDLNASLNLRDCIPTASGELTPVDRSTSNIGIPILSTLVEAGSSYTHGDQL